MTTIWVKFTEPGFHFWPDAKPPKEYLSWPHRHLFHVTVALEVTHDDREVEFHSLLNLSRTHFSTLLTTNLKTFTHGNETTLCSTLSCEQLAKLLLHQVSLDFGPRKISVSVSEDNECGAIVTNA